MLIILLNTFYSVAYLGSGLETIQKPSYIGIGINSQIVLPTQGAHSTSGIKYKTKFYSCKFARLSLSFCVLTQANYLSAMSYEPQKAPRCFRDGWRGHWLMQLI